MKLSIVTTLYRSADFIGEFHARISREARQLTDDYEIIMVDDGSPDESLKIALGLVDRDPRLRVVELSRNYGHHKAIVTGLEHADGDLVFLIDSDLEEPPELLGRFHEVMERERWDVVFGCQTERKGTWGERFGGAVAWALLKLLLPIQVPRNHSTVRLMVRAYARALVQYKEQKTAIGGLWVIAGFRQTGVDFVKGFRNGSSYTFLGRLGMLLDSITSFSEIPLYAVFFLGLAIFMFSGFIAAYLVGLRLTGTVLDGWVSVMISVWMLGGLAIFCLGVIGLYVSRIFIETKGRPYTIVRNTYRKTSAD